MAKETTKLTNLSEGRVVKGGVNPDTISTPKPMAQISGQNPGKPAGSSQNSGAKPR